MEGGEALGRLSPPNKFASRAEEEIGGSGTAFPGQPTVPPTAGRETGRLEGSRCHTKRTHAPTVLFECTLPVKKEAKLNPRKGLHSVLHCRTNQESLVPILALKTTNRREGRGHCGRRAGGASGGEPKGEGDASQSRVGFKLRKAGGERRGMSE